MSEREKWRLEVRAHLAICMPCDPRQLYDLRQASGPPSCCSLTTSRSDLECTLEVPSDLTEEVIREISRLTFEYAGTSTFSQSARCISKERRDSNKRLMSMIRKKQHKPRDWN